MLMTFKKKNINKGPKKRLEFSMYFIDEFSNMQLFLRLYLVLPKRRSKFNSLSESLNKSYFNFNLIY